MKQIKEIVATDVYGTIGHGLDMPGWYTTDDLKLVSYKTRGGETPVKGNPIIIGHNTAKSLMATLGKPFPGRTTIVVTSDGDPALEEAGFVVTKGMTAFYDALAYAETCPGKEIWIGGGGLLYQTARERIIVDEIHLTVVQGTFRAPEGVPEIKFCSFNNSYYERVGEKQIFTKREPSPGDKGNSHDFTIEVFKYIP